MDEAKPKKNSKAKDNNLLNPIAQLPSAILGFWPDSSSYFLREENGISLRDIHNGEKLREFIGEYHANYSAAATPDNRYALTGGVAVSLWDNTTNQVVWTNDYSIPHQSVLVQRISCSANNRRALIEVGDRVVVLDIAERREVHTFNQFAAHWSRAISPDGRFMLTGGNGKVLTLWDLESGQQVRQFTGHTSGRVHSVMIAANGELAYSCSGNDKTIRVWGFDSGSEIRCLKFSKKRVAENAGEYSRDGGRFLIRTFDENAVLVWDLESDQELARLPQSNYVTGARISPDGRYAATSDNGGNIFLWSLP